MARVIRWGNAAQAHFGRLAVRFLRDDTYAELAASWLDDEPIPDEATLQAIKTQLEQEAAAEEAAEQQRETNAGTIRQQVANSVYADMTAAEIVADVRAEIDAWTSLADAKATLRKLLPFIAAGVMHSYRDN